MVALILATVLAPPVYAAGCRGVVVGGPVTDAQTVGILSRQANAPVRVERVYRASGWSVFKLDPGGGDVGYMFFHGAPKAMPPAWAWGGAAARSEFADVIREVRTHNPGVPLSLAKCVATIVTAGDRQGKAARGP